MKKEQDENKRVEYIWKPKTDYSLFMLLSAFVIVVGAISTVYAVVLGVALLLLGTYKHTEDSNRLYFKREIEEIEVTKEEYEKNIKRK